MFVMLLERESMTYHSDAGVVTCREGVAQGSVAPMASVNKEGGPV